MSDDNYSEAYWGIHELASEMRERDARLITIIGRDCGDDTIELIYMFDEGGDVHERRFMVDAEQEVDSLSDFYIGAANMERENMDMLGMSFKGQEPGLLLVPGKGIVAPLRGRLEERS